MCNPIWRRVSAAGLAIGAVCLAFILATTQPLPAANLLPGAPPEVETGFTALFSGADLRDWEGDEKFWSVKDETIVGQTTAENPTKGNTFLIWKLGEVDDFELRLTYRITGGNSGVQYRSKNLGNFVVGGNQADIEDGNTWSGAHYEERARGILAKRGQTTTIEPGGKVTVEKETDGAALQAKIKKNDWNDYRITAVGNRLVHEINGTVMSDVTDNDKKNFRRGGILALQLHAGPPMKVEYRNIRLKNW